MHSLNVLSRLPAQLLERHVRRGHSLFTLTPVPKKALQKRVNTPSWNATCLPPRHVWGSTSRHPWNALSLCVFAWQFGWNVMLPNCVWFSFQHLFLKKIMWWGLRTKHGGSSLYCPPLSHPLGALTRASAGFRQPCGCLFSHHPCSSPWKVNIKLILDRMWHTPVQEEFFISQGGVADGPASQNLCWVLAHLLGAAETPHPSRQVLPVSFCSSLLYWRWAGPGGSWKEQSIWGKASITAPFLVFLNIRLSSLKVSE